VKLNKTYQAFAAPMSGKAPAAPNAATLASKAAPNPTH
jgi:hypothetical protein